jgi:hypothetical protein
LIALLIERFMPELLESGDSSAGRPASEDEAEQQGGQVDIVLDDDEEAQAGLYSSSSENFGEESGNAASEEEADEEERDDDFIEEVYRSGEQNQVPASGPAAEQGRGAEEGPRTAAAPAAASATGGAPGGRQSGGNAAESESSGGRAAREAYGGGSEEAEELFEAAGDIDELPDLEEYADSFESVAADQSGEQSESGGGYSPGSVEIDGEQEDPATVAKALRRFMKKDEEG